METIKIKWKQILFLFCLFAFFPAGRLAFADTADTSVFVVLLLPPSDLAAVTASYEQIDLSWSSVPGAESYNIYNSGV